MSIYMGKVFTRIMQGILCLVALGALQDVPHSTSALELFVCILR